MVACCGLQPDIRMPCRFTSQQLPMLQASWQHGQGPDTRAGCERASRSASKAQRSAAVRAGCRMQSYSEHLISLAGGARTLFSLITNETGERCRLGMCRECTSRARLSWGGGARTLVSLITNETWGRDANLGCAGSAPPETGSPGMVGPACSFLSLQMKHGGEMPTWAVQGVHLLSQALLGWWGPHARFSHHK